MPEIVLTVDIERKDKIVTVNGIGGKVSIAYVGDIDFTPLVDKLLDTISTTNTFSISINDKEELDEKESLLISTLSNIIDNYNEVVSSNEAEEG